MQRRRRRQLHAVHAGRAVARQPVLVAAGERNELVCTRNMSNAARRVRAYTGAHTLSHTYITLTAIELSIASAHKSMKNGVKIRRIIPGQDVTRFLQLQQEATVYSHLRSRTNLRL